MQQAAPPGKLVFLVPEGEKKEPTGDVRSFNRSGRHTDLFIATKKKKKNTDCLSLMAFHRLIPTSALWLFSQRVKLGDGVILAEWESLQPSAEGGGG